MPSEDIQNHLDTFSVEFLSVWLTNLFMERISQDILQKLISVSHRGNKFRFKTSWGCINDDGIFIFGVNYPFNPQNFSQNIVLIAA